jgi:hypothetical protein
MAMTLRLPDELKTEADAYAQKLGISVSALVAVALRDYLDGRTTPRSAPPSPEPPAPAEPALTPGPKTESAPASSAATPPLNRAARRRLQKQRGR